MSAVAATERKTAQHLDTRSDHFRGTYWYRDADSLGTPSTAVLKETLRQQKNALVHQPPRPRTIKDFPTLRSLPTGSFAGSLKSLSETSGSIRSLPTQLSDKPTSININDLRAQRTELIWKDFFTGNRTFTPSANLDNWIEERYDASYTTGGVTERQPKAYESITSQTMKAATKLYSDKRSTLAPRVPKVPEKLDDYRSHYYQLRRFNRPNYVYYADQDKDLAASDSNLRGRYWVGTAPTHIFKSIGQSTYGDHEPLEFQRRSKASDTKSRVLCGLKEGLAPEPQVLENYRNRWFGNSMSARAKWRSEYSTSFEAKPVALRAPTRFGPGGGF